jgi:hypothetical protein
VSRHGGAGVKSSRQEKIEIRGPGMGHDGSSARTQVDRERHSATTISSPINLRHQEQRQRVKNIRRWACLGPPAAWRYFAAICRGSRSLTKQFVVPVIWRLERSQNLYTNVTDRLPQKSGARFQEGRTSGRHAKRARDDRNCRTHKSTPIHDTPSFPLSPMTAVRSMREHLDQFA